MDASSTQSCSISDESYCSPWDLKLQEEKLKLLNDQHRFKSLSTKTTISIQKMSSTKQLEQRDDSPASCQCNYKQATIINTDNHEVSLRKLSNSLNPQTHRFGTINSMSLSNVSIKKKNKILITDESQPISFETALYHLKRLSTSNQNNSVNQIHEDYRKPWDTSIVSPTNSNHSGGSLQRISITDESKQSIEHYFWYHYEMSRRQAERILESTPSGSFLVRQSESGNQNDYSLSIRTTKGCMHMRICYSGGFYILGECSRPFLSVPSIINYFSQTPVPVRGASHIKLTTPILRWQILSSSLSKHEIL